MSHGEELFDLYDTLGRPLGQSKARAAVHRDGDWHRSTHLWIMTAGGCLLFQRRALDKDTWPGTLDASVGGHYQAGEGPEGLLREAQEELGLVCHTAELIALGQRRVESYQPGIVDREIQDVYLLRRDLPLTDYKPDPVEVDGLALLGADDAARLHSGLITGIEAAFLPRHASAPVTRTFTAADLVSGRGPYIVALARAVQAVLTGQRPLPLHLGEDEEVG